MLNYATVLLAEAISTENVKDMRFAFGLYDIIALLISFSFLMFNFYMNAHREILKNEVAERYNIRINKYPIISMSIYLLGFILNYINVYVGLLFLILGIIFHAIAYFQTAKAIKI